MYVIINVCYVTCEKYLRYTFAVSFIGKWNWSTLWKPLT